MPSIVSVSDDGKVKHNGRLKGRVYRVADRVTNNDIYEHPKSTMGTGWEYITKKEFRLEFLYEYDISHHPDDILSEKEIKKIEERNIPQ